MSDKITMHDPAEIQGLDAFKPAIRRGILGDKKLEFLTDYLTRNPDATLGSGEGGILLKEINRLKRVEESLLEKQKELIDRVESIGGFFVFPITPSPDTVP